MSLPLTHHTYIRSIILYHLLINYSVQLIYKLWIWFNIKVNNSFETNSKKKWTPVLTVCECVSVPSYTIRRALTSPRFRVSDPHILARSSKNLAARALWTPRLWRNASYNRSPPPHLVRNACASIKIALAGHPQCSIRPEFESQHQYFFRPAFFYQSKEVHCA